MSQEYSRPYILQPQSPFKEQVLKTWRNGSTWRDSGSVPGPTNNVTYLYHIGQSGYSATGCSIVTRVNSAGSTITWADIGIWKGFFPLTLTAAFSYTGAFEELPTLTRVGMGNLGAVLGTTSGIKVVECSFTASTCDPEDELWLAIGFSANSIPSMNAGMPDALESGRFLTVTGRPDSLTGAGPDTLQWGATSSYLLDFAVMLYG